MSKKPVNVIIHGHFYQPPREDPWTDQIGMQPSAYPAKNWNYRITAECYAPNCFSRVLGSDGRIIEIINNYKYISFNFGPTLLSWLEKKENDIYNLILEADKESIKEHNGHGNAIAQIYNHVIMPLQKRREKITEIIWGLEDFKARFSRESEGIWLSETAIDYETVDLLIDYNIKFVILSPNQAKAYKKTDQENWIANNDTTPIPTTRAYKIVRNHGSLVVFFFNKTLSTAVSFEHLLHSSENFANSILNSVTNDNDLITIATDGEIYGHHEPFADMCLARLISEYHIKKKKIKLLNFAEYLDTYPVEYEVELSLGDDGKGSSWSCFHGVGRWYRDCGCHTGGLAGWNQKWREPLRNAFDYVKEKVDEIYERTITNYVSDPWNLLDRYIEAILGLITYNEFLNKYIKNELTDLDRLKILSLLESEKNALFMYTSCGWFFTELSGIETVQNIKYAYKAIYLLKRFFEQSYNEIKETFEKKLELSKSNIKEFENGKWILENWIYKHIQNLSHIANNIIFLKILVDKSEYKDIEIFETYLFEFLSLKTENNYSSGTIRVYHINRYLQGDYSFLFIKKSCNEFKSYLIESEKEYVIENIKNDILNKSYKEENDDIYRTNEVRIYSEIDLANEVKDYMIKVNFDKKIDSLVNLSFELLNDIKCTLDFYKRNKLALSEIYKTELKFIAETYFYYVANSITDFPTGDYYKNLLTIFEYLNNFNVEVNKNEISESFSKLLYKKMNEIDSIEIESDIYKKALVLLEFSYKVNLKIEKSRSENIVFKLLKNMSNSLINNIYNATTEEEKTKYLMQFRHLIVIADMFNIDTTVEKENFFKQFKELNNISSEEIIKKYKNY